MRLTTISSLYLGPGSKRKPKGAEQLLGSQLAFWRAKVGGWADLGATLGSAVDLDFREFSSCHHPPDACFIPSLSQLLPPCPLPCFSPTPSLPPLERGQKGNVYPNKNPLEVLKFLTLRKKGKHYS